jgi:hypothetical protein
MNIFPSDAAYLCVGAPAWFRAPAEGRNPGGRRRVLITWEQSDSDLPRLDAYYGLVVVNGRDLTDQKLRDAGFAYVRRFAVVPSIHEARWFIPLDAPAISSAAFCLYTPTRMSARVKRFAVRLATRTPLPFWYRDQIQIAQRALPPLEDTLQAFFPGTALRLALSSGAPEGARNRKASVAVLRADGKILAFAKLAGSDLSRRLLQHEAEVLASMPNSALPAPHLLSAGEVDGTYIAIFSPLSGRPAGTRLTPAHRQFLKALRIGPMKPATATALVGTLPARIAALPSPCPDLAAIFDEVLPELERLVLPETIIHGDFVPGNLCEYRGNIAAFDWEYGELSGVPLIDELYHLLIVGYQIEGWTIDRACDSLAEVASSSALGLRPEQIRAIQVVLLLYLLVRFLSEGYDRNHDMVAWFLNVLARLRTTTREIVVT